MQEEHQMIQSPREQTKVTSCDSFHGTIEFIGKRWMGIIIYHLLDGEKRYHELYANIHGISDRLLTERLRELEQHGFVEKSICTESTKKVTYHLTEIGMELEDIIQAICKWVKKNRSHAYIDEDESTI